jgi:hypothetical protein
MLEAHSEIRSIRYSDWAVITELGNAGCRVWKRQRFWIGFASRLAGDKEICNGRAATTGAATRAAGAFQFHSAASGGE